VSKLPEAIPSRVIAPRYTGGLPDGSCPMEFSFSCARRGLGARPYVNKAPCMHNGPGGNSTQPAGLTYFLSA